MNKWAEGWPDWRDSGKRVEVLFDGGEIVVGRLDADDFISASGSGDEIPIFHLYADDGRKLSIDDMDEWREIVS